MEGRIRVFTGIEVDILADGALDLDDEVLAQMDVVIASVHTRFEQSREEMTARVLRAIENPYVRILGHPTGRLLLRREPFALDMGAVLRRAAELGVAVEHNAAPERLDLNDRDLRLAKELGCRIVIEFRLARQPQPGQDGVWRPAVAARLAAAGGCAEYAGSGGVSGGAEGEALTNSSLLNPGSRYHPRKCHRPAAQRNWRYQAGLQEFMACGTWLELR